MRRLTSRCLMIVVALALAACAAPPASPTAQAPTPAAAASVGAVREPPPSPSPPPTAAPSPAPPALEPIPNPFERRELAPGESIAGAGLYFMDVATGAVDAWTLSGAHYSYAEYSASPDNRWLIAAGSYLADRHTGATFHLADGRILATEGEHVLLLAGQRLWVVEPGQPARGPLPIALSGPNPPQAVMSPHGATAAILSGRTLYLVQVDGATCRAIGEVADPPGLTFASMALQTDRRGETIVASSFWRPGTNSTAHSVQRIERYSWQGERLGELVPPLSGLFAYSPDGRWVAWDEMLSGLMKAVVVADAETLVPRLRVAGATLCFHDFGTGDWLADSSGLIVRTSAGYRIVTLEGQLVAVPTAPGEPMSEPDEPLPAPDRADLFAVGRRGVVDSAGKAFAVAALGTGPDPDRPADLYPWGLDSTELRFALPHLGHGGHCGDWEYMLPARVERPPFGPLALAVGLPADDCVNLRAAPGAKAQALSCLPGGTRLSLAPPAEGYYRQGIAWTDNTYWLRVRAADGQEGWVDAEAGKIGWAE